MKHLLILSLWSVALNLAAEVDLDRPVDLHLRHAFLGQAVAAVLGVPERSLFHHGHAVAGALVADRDLALDDLRCAGEPRRAVLDRLCRSRGLRWRVVDGAVVVDRPLEAAARRRLEGRVWKALAGADPLAWAEVLDAIAASGDLEAVGVALAGLVVEDEEIRKLTLRWCCFEWLCLTNERSWGRTVALRDDAAAQERLVEAYRRAAGGERVALRPLLVEARCRAALPVLREELRSGEAVEPGRAAYQRGSLARTILAIAPDEDHPELWEWCRATTERDAAGGYRDYHKRLGSALLEVARHLQRHGDAARRRAVADWWQSVRRGAGTVRRGDGTPEHLAELEPTPASRPDIDALAATLRRATGRTLLRACRQVDGRTDPVLAGILFERVEAAYARLADGEGQPLDFDRDRLAGALCGQLARGVPAGSRGTGDEPVLPLDPDRLAEVVERIHRHEWNPRYPVPHAAWFPALAGTLERLVADGDPHVDTRGYANLVGWLAGFDVPEAEELLLRARPHAVGTEKERAYAVRSYCNGLAARRSPRSLDRLQVLAEGAGPERREALFTLLRIPCPQAGESWRLAVHLGPDELADLVESGHFRHGPGPDRLLPVLERLADTGSPEALSTLRKAACAWLGWPLNTRRGLAHLDALADLARLSLATLPDGADAATRAELLPGIPNHMRRSYLAGGSAVAQVLLERALSVPPAEDAVEF